MKTVPGGGRNPAVIVYGVKRLIEHSLAPVVFLSAPTGDPSKQKDAFKGISNK
jgi:hypothetical protein